MKPLPPLRARPTVPRSSLRSLVYAAVVPLLLATGCPKAPVPTTPFPGAPPAVTPDSTWAPQAPEVLSTVAGAQLWHVHRPGLPLVSLRLVLPGGSSMDPTDQPGLTAFSDAMLLRGAGGLDAAAFSAALQRDAIDIGIDTHRTGTVVSVDCTADTLPRALELLDSALTEPRFDPDEVARARSQRVQSRRDALDDPRSVAAAVGWTLWFGPDSPLAHGPAGTVAGLEAVEAEDLSQSWSARERPAGARWIVVGDVEPDRIQSLLDRQFGDWAAERADTPAPEVPPPPGRTAPHAKGGRVMVDNPGASQTVLRVWMPGWTPDDPQRVAADLGVVALGGTFTSRLNSLLREEKGYTYGARASLATGRGFGAVSVYTNVFIDTTGPALTDLTAELRRITEGVSADETAKARASRRTDAIELSAGRASTADHLTGLALDGRGADGLLADLHMSARVEAPDVARVLSRLSLDDALVVVVGDLSTIRAPVEAALDGPWTELDSHGQPLP